MGRVLVVVAEWLLRNAVQKILFALGLGVFSELGTMSAIKYAFNQQLLGLNGLAPNLLALMGIYGIDHVLSSFISAAMFVMALSSGKLAIRKAG